MAKLQKNYEQMNPIVMLNISIVLRYIDELR